MDMRAMSWVVLGGVLAWGGAAMGTDFWWPEQWPVDGRDGIAADTAWNDPSQLPLAAVVRIGGCSGTLVSPRGLILTAYHCLEHLPELAGLEGGFLARDGQPEVSLESLPPITRTLTIDPVDAPERACEGVTESRCRVVPMFAGAAHRRILEREWTGPRLVYLPDRRLARFGGDADDFSWPRHVADLALIRVDLQQDEPFIAIQPDGATDGDLVRVIGYPVQSRRFLRAVELSDEVEWTLPERIRRYQAVRDRIIALAAAESGAGRQLLDRIDRQLQQDRARLEAMQREGIVDRARQREDALRAWLESDQTLSGDFLDDLEALDQSEVLARMVRQRDALYGDLRGFAALLDVAIRLYRHSLDAAPVSGSVLAGDLQRLAIDPALDRALFLHHVEAYAALPASRRVAALDQALGLIGDDPDLSGLELRVDALYAGSRLHRTDDRLVWLNRPAEAFRTADDAFIQLAVALEPAEREMRSRQKARADEVAMLRARYGLALHLYHQELGTPLADDASATLRIGGGRIAGYSPQDGLMYRPQTHLGGLEARGASEGGLDEAWRQAMAGSATVPVDVLSTASVLPGHSGAPVLDVRGGLVGVIFDSNRQALNADRWSAPENARAMHVDIRLLLWLLRQQPDSEALLSELGAGPSQATR